MNHSGISFQLLRCFKAFQCWLKRCVRVLQYCHSRAEASIPLLTTHFKVSVQPTDKNVSNAISLLAEQLLVIRRQLIYQLRHSTFLTATRGRTGHGQRQAHKYKYYKYRNTQSQTRQLETKTKDKERLRYDRPSLDLILFNRKKISSQTTLVTITGPLASETFCTKDFWSKTKFLTLQN